MAIARRSQQHNPIDLVPQALRYADLLTELVATAKKAAHNNNFGWRGRQKHGIGENFWQFRIYNEGDSPNRIDWRRSARDDKLYIKERELETQQNIWIWPDQSATMQFCSKNAQRSKMAQALLLSFILGELMLQANDPVGIPQILQPISHKDGAEKMALALLRYKNEKKIKPVEEIFPKFPDIQDIKAPCDFVLISDFLYDSFLDPYEKIEKKPIFQSLIGLSQQNARIHLIEIIDPVEEIFPYKGTVTFSDIASEEKKMLDRVDLLQKDYHTLYAHKKAFLNQISRQYNWTYLQTYTHKALEATLTSLAHIFSRVNTYL